MKFLVVLALVGIYGFGVLKFWRGFERTSFERTFGNRVILSLLWPVLFVANPSYRKNFTKALKGSRY
jgi:hypothetical protein